MPEVQLASNSRRGLARSSGPYLSYRKDLSKPDVLILDAMGVRKMSSIAAQDLCEINEERSIAKDTIFTTQLPPRSLA